MCVPPQYQKPGIRPVSYPGTKASKFEENFGKARTETIACDVSIPQSKQLMSVKKLVNVMPTLFVL
jgi:hypothetical protein